jgi:predicted metal-binding protein
LEIKIHNKSTTLEASERIHLSRCTCTLPRCVFLVINDNSYEVMFHLSLYEGIFHR